MEVKAQAKYVRISTGKVKRIVGMVRGKPASEALVTLSFMPHHGARVAAEVIKSAIANARNNYKLDPEKLIISRIFADRATPYVRYRAQARGRGTKIYHKQSHVTVYVSAPEFKSAPKKSVSGPTEQIKGTIKKSKGRGKGQGPALPAGRQVKKEEVKSGAESSSKRA